MAAKVRGSEVCSYFLRYTMLSSFESSGGHLLGHIICIQTCVGTLNSPVNVIRCCKHSSVTFIYLPLKVFVNFHVPLLYFKTDAIVVSFNQFQNVIQLHTPSWYILLFIISYSIPKILRNSSSRSNFENFYLFLTTHRDTTCSM